MFDKGGLCFAQFLKFSRYLLCTKTHVLSFKNTELNKSQALPSKSHHVASVEWNNVERNTQLG